MSISKELRERVKNKYGGRCAYTGTKLKDDWQVDHMVSRAQHKYGLATDTELNSIDNLMPTQRIVNHYKRSLSLRQFREWYLGGLHERLKKLPKNPRTEKSIRHKEYLLEVAELFGITEDKPFDGVFYFEKLESGD